MNLKPERKEDIDINLTPLIDVVFILLIFFMVSTTFNKESEIVIDLPEASEQKTPVQEDVLQVSIDAQGRFYINDAEVVNTRLVTVKRAMETIAKGNRKLTVVISADANTPHQAVVTAMDAARQLGLTRISITTRRPQSGKSP